MSHVPIFIAGAMVTIVVMAALALLVWGAILDGRDEAERREQERQRQLVAAARPLSTIERTSDRVPPRAA